MADLLALALHTSPSRTQQLGPSDRLTVWNAIAPTSDMSLDSTAGSVVLKTAAAARLTIATAVITATVPIRGESGTAAAPTFSFSVDTSLGMFRGGVGVLGFATDGSERVRIGSTGKVGMGTTAPSARLHVVGASGTFQCNDVETDATDKWGRWGITHYTAAEEPFFGVLHRSQTAANTLFLGGGNSEGNAATDIQLLTATNNTTLAGTERMRVTSTGLVGINNATPVGKLDVVGDLLLISDTILDATAKAGRVGQWHYTNSEESLALIVGVAGSSTNLVKVGGGDSTMNTATAIIFYTASTTTTLTGTERMRILSTGEVGINHSTPATLLHVRGTAALSPSIVSERVSADNDGGFFTGRKARGTIGSETQALADDSLAGFFGQGYHSGSAYGNSQGYVSIHAAENFTSTAQGTYLKFVTTPTGSTSVSERLRITDDGMIGHGTASPDTRSFHHAVGNNGSFIFQDVATDAAQKVGRWGVQHFDNADEPFYGLVFVTTSGANSLRIGGSSSLGNAATSLVFYTAANSTTVTGTQRMVIDSSGFVGINNTPATRLDITGTDNTTIFTLRFPVAQASVTAADVFVEFRSTTGVEGSIAGTAVAGVIAYNTFTGSHWTRVEDRSKLGRLTLIESTGLGMDEKEHLVCGQACFTRKSKGVIGFSLGHDREGRDLAAGLGTVPALVRNMGKNIEIGDLLHSSDDGTCELQDDDVVHSYTVAKARSPIRWLPDETHREIGVVSLCG